MNTLGRSELIRSIQKISFVKMLVLSVLTGGFYTTYWYFTRTKAILKSAQREVPYWVYFLVLVNACSILFGYFDLFEVSSIALNWKWVSIFALGICLELVSFIWILWLRRLLYQHWNLRLSSNKTLEIILLFFFGFLYFQHKLNRIPEWSEQTVIN